MAPQSVLNIKNDLKNKKTLGYGLMSFTWRQNPVPIDDAVKTMSELLEVVPADTHKILFNLGEFYGEPYLNLKYAKKFIDSLDAENKKKIFVSVKGGMDNEKIVPVGTREGITKSVEGCLDVLGYIDIFECARMDMDHWEESFDTLIEYVEAGKIGALSLSEVTKEQIEMVFNKKNYKDYIACCELELSLFSKQIIENGICDYLNKHDVSVVAYSPLGRGLLTKQIKSVKDIPAGDFRSQLKRFQDDAMVHNMQLVNFLEENFTSKRDISLPQLALAWVRKNNTIYKNINFIPIPSGTTPARVQENFSIKEISDEDFAKINDFLKSFQTAGDRYETA
ncbi:related to Putative pyridoxal reductase [Hanseniaspora guilliermondii]|uniref:Related to Putative pyridoxal reductase n=1 Tax=Hanseniaspora guilliermondii TaxID=56406 RepID=A0A1L0B4S1_9ASCO|nr:related to Putative pyridoxal reductase [Hanseniaspora guilliermondii]